MNITKHGQGIDLSGHLCEKSSHLKRTVISCKFLLNVWDCKNKRTLFKIFTCAIKTKNLVRNFSIIAPGHILHMKLQALPMKWYYDIECNTTNLPRCDMIFWCTLYLHLNNLYHLNPIITYMNTQLSFNLPQGN